MKKLMLVFFVIFSVTKIQAQNYQIAFAGTGASTAVDSVKVENLTQFTNKTLKGSDLLHLIGTVGINELNLNSKNTIRIYPNPSTGVCTVGFEATTQSLVTIGLYDMTGKRILLVQELLTIGHHTYSLSGIHRGIYLLKVESDKYSYTAKIISSNEQSGITEIIHTGTTPGIDRQSIGSNTNKIENLKSGKSLIDMQYTSGDILKLTGFSGGIYRTVFMLIPTQSQTVTFNFVACTDADGNNYPIVQIGTQIWMAENLKTTKYRYGDSISNVTDSVQWRNLTTGAYCNYENDTKNSTTYGRLYNWYSLKDSRNVCPNGWHVATDAEWSTLTSYLGESVAGNKLKETGNSHWQSSNAKATNETGFSALPGGRRDSYASWSFLGLWGYWWSSTEYNTDNADYIYMGYGRYDVSKSYTNKTLVGFSVRCVKDEAPIAFSCGSPITINHVAGAVAPVTKTVTYGTVTNIPGETSKCWITSNLGASQQATAVNDATEASSGWYWQFNRKQGYKHDGTTRTPNSTWISSINESSDWAITNDPCTIELGSGWRIPTSTEWTNVYQSDNSWTTMTGSCNSSLKIHAAGALATSNGLLGSQGSYGAYWSSMQGNATTTGWNLSFCSSYSGMYNTGLKAYGFSLRCIKDAGSSTTTPTITTSVVSNITQTTATGGGNVTSDGGATVTARGVCWGSSPNPTTANYKTIDGNGTGTFVSSLTSLIPNTLYYVRSYATNSIGTAYGNEVNFTTLQEGTTCGSSITINHVAGAVAPVTKTVTYGTVTNIPGETSKCWITSNLGASQQATAVNDATETSAGWYWQFNRKQGYKHDGTTRTPNSTWITSINENSDWVAANDPCLIELGSGWRIPTSTEWTNVDSVGNWTSWTNPWNSGLKLHAAGRLKASDGSLQYLGAGGYICSSIQYSSVNYGMQLMYGSGDSFTSFSEKANGNSVRCLKGAGSSSTTPTVTTTAITSITQTTATSGGNVTSDGGTTVIARGVCWNTSPNPTTANRLTIYGGGTGTFVSNLTGLTPNTPYYVRAYATNSVGTVYGNEVNFTTLSVSGFTCGSSITVNHVSGVVAPVAKSVTYGTVTNIPGEPSKCWITSNLGADHQATGKDDATEASAGWYWQFNRKQGYKHDGTTRTPNSAWISSINESSDWAATNDPCLIELGSGWRIPTSTEWTNVDSVGNWTSWTNPWNSGLKLHAAGALYNDGSLRTRNTYGYYWSSTQYIDNYGWILYFHSGDSYTIYSQKLFGYSLRCIKDAGSSTTTPTITTSVVSNITQTAATGGGNVTSDGGTTVTARGVCWGTSPNPTTTNSKTTDGSGTGTFVSSLASLTMNTPYYVRAYAINSVGTTYGNEVNFTTLSLSGFSCGSSIIINHIAGVVAPVTKTVTYGTVSNIPGDTTKCWITSNLGASQQATAVNDATETSAGWYWQFNRKQGYKHDGTTRTPNSTWITSINENSDWVAANDPCLIELGNGWRIPTSTEWTNVDASASWTNWNGPWNSALKLHAAGDLYYGDGLIYGRGSRGYYWSSSQDSDYGYGRNLSFSSSNSLMDPNYKASAVSIRCLKNAGSSTTTPTVTTTAVTSITQTTATSGGNVTSDGGATVTARGVCWSTSPNPTTANSKTTNGSGTGTFVSNLTSLTPNTLYYVRAYATNSVGTAYGNEVNFTTLSLSGFSCGSSITINHVAGAVAPVTKTVTYGTVSNIPGDTTKCWITSNLGASQQATAVSDATEASAGWYWQFNRKQGYKHDGTTRTPNSTWTTPINENLDWQAANDPCTIELGNGWRIPTSTEWTNVDASGSWTNWNGPWNSALKLHAAGDLYYGDGYIYGRGSRGYYWSSSQDSDYGYGRNLSFSSSNSLMDPNYKASGVSIRCLKDVANTGKSIVEMSIGPQGGTISSSEVAFTIPPGSLSSTTLIKIIETETINGGENQISKTYQLVGIPFDYKGILDVMIKYSEPLEGKSYVTCYFNSSDRNLEAQTTTCKYFEAKDSLGYLVSSVDFGDGQSTLLKSSGSYMYSDFQLEFAATSKMGSIEQKNSDNDRMGFKIIYPNKIDEKIAQNVALYFSRIEEKFYDLGFRYSARNNSNYFPVFIQNDPSAANFGSIDRGFPWTINGTYIQLNYPVCSTSDEELRSTIAHEFFHFIHACYGMDDNPTWWYQDALCTFAEEMLQANPESFYSSQFLAFYNTPFNGMEAGINWIDPNTGVASIQQHGYGMGLMIKEFYYNSQSTNNSTLLNLVQKVGTNNMAPIEALMSTFSDFKPLWKNYFNDFFTGSLTPIQAGTIRSESTLNPGGSRIWNINSAADSLKTYYNEMPDLSTTVYRIHLNTITKQALSIVASTTPDINDIEVRVYKYNTANGSPVPIFIGKSVLTPQQKLEVSVAGLAEIKKTCNTILVAITNSHAEKPFTGSKFVNVKMSFTDCPSSVTYAGKKYNTVLIENQCWLKENLDIGTMIDVSQDPSNDGIIQKYCYNNDLNNCATYGGLYQWNEAMEYKTTLGSKGICPEGWHIPTLEDFKILAESVGIDGNALKEIGQGKGKDKGTNTSGFSALLAGCRYEFDKSFQGLDITADFWSSYYGGNATHAYLLFLASEASYIYYLDTWAPRERGYSVRCVMD